jgi:hypothetical protein
VSFKHVKNPILRCALTSGKFQFPGQRQICYWLTCRAVAKDAGDDAVSDDLWEVRAGALNDFEKSGSVEDLRNVWRY